MIIDFHTHIFGQAVRDERAKYIHDDPLFSELYSSPKATLASAEDLIASMDEFSIDRSVVLNIAWSSSALCHETNQYLLEAAARYPRRLTAFGMVRLDDPHAALAEIEILAGGGARGIGEIRPDVSWLQNPELVRPVIQAIADRRLLLLTHASEPIGHQYQGKGCVTPQSLYGFLCAFPDLPIVCAHWGGGLPFYALMPEVRKSLQNVYFDSAASSYLYQPAVFRLVAALGGADKILFGTDFPVLKQGRLLKEIDSQPWAAGERDQFLAGNALRLLGLA